MILTNHFNSTLVASHVVANIEHQHSISTTAHFSSELNWKVFYRNGHQLASGHRLFLSSCHSLKMKRKFNTFRNLGILAVSCSLFQLEWDFFFLFFLFQS